MKFSSAVLLPLIDASGGTGQLSSQIKRTVGGSWIEQIYGHRGRRAPIDGEAGFQSLGKLMAFMNGANVRNENSLNNAIAALKDEYTNYGCYCWIDGVESGVIGGGRVKDVSDHHCKELYRCYKCANIDYSKNYTDVNYRVDLNIDSDTGARTIDCSVNSKSDAENVCECDKRFAEKIADTRDKCQDNAGRDDMYGEYCMDEKYRTGTGGGSFDPRAQCDKQFHGHDKSKCCGIYPNRYPYDPEFKECCQHGMDDLAIFSLFPRDECEPNDGRVVESVAGDPHTYVFA
jgi:hypothetical protein